MKVLQEYPDNHFDLIVTDPPYALVSDEYREGKNYKGGFMGKSWDSALPSVEIWKECYRTLKEGKMAFVMCAPRQDVLSRMIIRLQDAGFRTNYSSIYHTFASGFPKAANISKMMEKKNGKTPESEKMKGAYIGCQMKPAVEVILVVSKGKSLTWLDNCRIPYSDKTEDKGRFPANLAIQDDVLQDYSRYFSLDSWANRYKIISDKTADTETYRKTFPFLICPKASKSERNKGCEDLPIVQGGPGFSQYHEDTKIIRKNPLPNQEEFVQYIKQKRLEKGLTIEQMNKYLDSKLAYTHYESLNDFHRIVTPENYIKLKKILDLDDRYDKQMLELIEVDRPKFKMSGSRNNSHPTVKPLKLMSYLVTLGSREGDFVLDPFCGSGTTCIAAQTLHRNFVGIEINQEYYNIAQSRLSPYLEQTKLV